MKKKVLVIQFRHETNTFCPKKADTQAYKNFVWEVGEDMFSRFRGGGTEVGAFLDVFEKRDDIELIPTVALAACPCGTVTKEVYDFVVSEVKKVISQHNDLDAVIINFHGAMVSEEHQDGEGDLLEIIRSLVGNEIPIITTLDLHANVTSKMATNATALFPYETYPHIDGFETGKFASNIMARTLDGEISPTMAYRRIPYLLPLFPSDFPEIKPIYDLAKELEGKDGVLSVRFSHGFFAADIEEMGMAVMVVTDKDKQLAEEIADIMAKKIEDSIPQLKRYYPSLDEALDIAEKEGDGPVVIADASDNPGAGGLGDTTHVLRRILERGIKGAAIATIVDPESVEKCVEAGVGSNLELNLGGWSDVTYSGEPIKVNAYVKMITDGKYVFKGKMDNGLLANQGKTAVLMIEGNTVLVSSLPRQPLDLEVFRSHGIAPEEQKILVTKSAIHYRASYGTVAREMIAVSVPGYAVPIPELMNYKHWKGNKD